MYGMKQEVNSKAKKKILGILNNKRKRIKQSSQYNQLNECDKRNYERSCENLIVRKGFRIIADIHLTF